MIEFLITFLVFLFVIVIMAVGVLRGRPPIAGSCGGLGAMGVDGACEICGGNPDKCEASDNLSEKPAITMRWKPSNLRIIPLGKQSFGTAICAATTALSWRHA